jgi:hypothetical protein
MTDRCRLDFPGWVPEAAKGELQRLANDPETDHRLLERLASYEVMRGVWEKLPAAAHGRECLIIRWTHAIARIVEAWQKIEQVRKYSALRTAKKVARSASKLRDAMEQTRGDARGDFWQFLWPGDRQITFEVALSVVEQLATFYSAADVWYKDVVEVSNELSTLRKKNTRTARETLFARFLASCFQVEFGKPLDAVVAALSSVAFDREGEGALAPTIRGRRRSAPRKGTFAKAPS